MRWLLLIVSLGGCVTAQGDLQDIKTKALSIQFYLAHSRCLTTECELRKKLLERTVSIIHRSALVAEQVCPAVEEQSSYYPWQELGDEGEDEDGTEDREASQAKGSEPPAASGPTPSVGEPGGDDGQPSGTR